jgi:acetylglutamate kinase
VISVIKLGGRVQSDASLVPILSELWANRRGPMCIVHGGGDEITSLQRTLGREPTFVNGRRITTSEDIELVRMVLSGSVNKRLVSMLVAAGLPAVGISGEDGGLLSAEPIDEKEFGRSGRPVSASVELTRALFAAGFLPVISPVANDVTSSTGEALNVNGDDAAAVIAAALRAELWLVADVEGVMNRDRELLPALDPAHVDSLVADGTVNSGMRAKLEAGFDALAAGAAGVRVGGLEALRGKGTGTLLSLTPSMT